MFLLLPLEMCWFIIINCLCFLFKLIQMCCIYLMLWIEEVKVLQEMLSIWKKTMIIRRERGMWRKWQERNGDKTKKGKDSMGIATSETFDQSDDLTYTKTMTKTNVKAKGILETCCLWQNDYISDPLGIHRDTSTIKSDMGSILNSRLCFFPKCPQRSFSAGATLLTRQTRNRFIFDVNKKK